MVATIRRGAILLSQKPSRIEGHPAKMARGLLTRIYDELFAMGAVQRGDTILDPFGGVGTTGILGAPRGLRVMCVELEERFCAFARANVERHRVQWEGMGYPIPIIVQGDSRRLQAVLGDQVVHCVVSSPPYAESISDGTKSGRPTGMTHRHTQGGDFGRSLKAMSANGYGTTCGQLGAMPAGDVAAVISSPPYNLPMSQDHNGRRGGRRGTEPSETGAFAKYGSTPGQLEGLPMGEIDAVISSPPYGEIAAGAGGLNTQPPQHAGQQGGRSAAAASQATDQRYGDADGQMGKMALGEVDAIVSSPPYAGTAVCNLANYESDKLIRAKASGRTAARATWGHNAGSAGSDGYGESAGQLARLPEDAVVQRNETFWVASRAVLAECHALLRPGGFAVFVVKAFVRDKRIVDFPGDWRRLCEAVGFETVQEVHASLVTETCRPHLFDGERVTRTERKSFFRRLHERRSPETRIDHEVVWFLRKLS